MREEPFRRVAQHHSGKARPGGRSHDDHIDFQFVPGHKLKIDMVVMGTAARTGLSRMMLGNTAERLLSHLRCSLMAVKPPGFCCPMTALSEDDFIRTNPATEKGAFL